MRFAPATKQLGRKKPNYTHHIMTLLETLTTVIGDLTASIIRPTFASQIYSVWPADDCLTRAARSPSHVFVVATRKTKVLDSDKWWKKRRRIWVPWNTHTAKYPNHIIVSIRVSKEKFPLIHQRHCIGDWKLWRDGESGCVILIKAHVISRHIGPYYSQAGVLI